jgi:hypothetical protein
MALNAPRKVQERTARQFAAQLLGGVTVFQGALVSYIGAYAGPARAGAGVDNAAKAAEAATMAVVGVAEETVVADAVNGVSRAPYRAGTFLLKNGGGGDAITTAEIGDDCFVIDDETVGKTNPNSTRPKAGRIVDVEDVGVWVRVGA